MIYQLHDIIAAVRSAANLTPVSQFDDSFAPEALTVEELIRRALPEAASEIILTAPLDNLEAGHSFSESPLFWTGAGRGWIPLPDNFLRLVRFRMSDWIRPVTATISADNMLYCQMWSPWQGIGGNPARPVAAVVNRSEGLALEFFSCYDETAVIEEALYLPRPDIDRHDGIDILDRCYNRVIQLLAEKVKQYIGYFSGLSQ